MEMRVVDGSRSPVSPFGSAVSLDPARRVPRNDQPAPLAVLGGCRPEVTISTPGRSVQGASCSFAVSVTQ